MLIIFLWPTGTYPFEADLVVPRTFAQRHGPRRQWTNSERTLRLSGRLANSLETDVDGCGRMWTDAYSMEVDGGGFVQKLGYAEYGILQYLYSIF